MAAVPPIDPCRCPLCSQPNRCAMAIERATGQAPAACWCTQVDFSRELLATLPEASRGQACICRDCAQRSAAAAA